MDPAQVGLGLTAFVGVDAADHSEAWRSEFLDAIAEMPEIMEVHRLAGDVDYLLRVVVTDMSAFDAFYQRLTKRVRMKSVTSRFTMETVRASTVYPLMADRQANGPVPTGR